MSGAGQKEEAYFQARIRNLFELCDKLGVPRFSDFLSEEEAARALALARHGGLPFRFWGGYAGAGRVMLGVFPEWMEPEEDAFPIGGFTFRYPAAFSLTHRDFLGSLMGQQLRREIIGDILVREGEAYVFADERVEKVLMTQMDRIGRVGVEVQKGAPRDIAVEQQFREIRGTLASLRLDAAVALCCGVSREKAAAMITAGLVQKNHLELQNVSAALENGDILSIRGKGKFRLETDGALTRKGRVAVRVLQYL